MDININPKELKDIVKEYEYDPDIMCDEDERVHLIKEAMTHLDVSDRIIWCLYMDMQSSRKLGNLLGVSHNIILKEVARIKNLIRTEYDKLIDNNPNDSLYNRP